MGSIVGGKKKYSKRSKINQPRERSPSSGSTDHKNNSDGTDSTSEGKNRVDADDYRIQSEQLSKILNESSGLMDKLRKEAEKSSSDNDMNSSIANIDDDSIFYPSDSSEVDTKTVSGTPTKKRSRGEGAKSKKDRKNKKKRKGSREMSSGDDIKEEFEHQEVGLINSSPTKDPNDDNYSSIIEKVKQLCEVDPINQLEGIGGLVSFHKENIFREDTFKDRSKEEKIHLLRETITVKYNNLPKIRYGKRTVKKCKPYFNIVLQILNGKIISPYYNEAKTVCKASSKAYLSVNELRSLDIKKFIAGFYGLRRQYAVGECIMEEYKDILLKSRSPVVKWWGVQDFCTYVLAPEVLIMRTIKDMKCYDKTEISMYKKELSGLTKDQLETLEDRRFDVYDIFQETAEYGLCVTDSQPLERWEKKQHSLPHTASPFSSFSSSSSSLSSTPTSSLASSPAPPQLSPLPNTA